MLLLHSKRQREAIDAHYDKLGVFFIKIRKRRSLVLQVVKVVVRGVLVRA